MHRKNVSRHPECNQIWISGKGAPVHEIYAQTKKNTELPTRPSIVLCLNDGGGGCVGMVDIRKHT